MAATSIITINAYFLYCFNISDVTTPIFPRKNAITGNWKTNPIIKVSVVKVLIYDVSVILLSTIDETLYVPKNLNDIGKSMKYDISKPITKSEYVIIAICVEYFFSFSYKAGVMK